jgi:hypothetical protein
MRILVVGCSGRRMVRQVLVTESGYGFIVMQGKPTRFSGGRMSPFLIQQGF